MNVDEAMARRRDNSGVNDREEEVTFSREEGERIFARVCCQGLRRWYLLSYSILPIRSLSARRME